MNSVTLVGRLTRDLETRTTKNGETTVNGTLAVDRRGKDNGADFIRIVIFGKMAEATAKYMRKGSRLGVVGRIQTGQYQDKNGNTVYTTDVVANSVEFLESKGESAQNTQNVQQNVQQPMPQSSFSNPNSDVWDATDNFGQF